VTSPVANDIPLNMTHHVSKPSQVVCRHCVVEYLFPSFVISSTAKQSQYCSNFMLFLNRKVLATYVPVAMDSPELPVAINSLTRQLIVANSV